ncbi:MAG: ATP-dependent zinc protease [Flavobacteriales bacterium]|nr:ATP-dependent zinc protease [Flavobacteriales bacterium]
MNDHEPLIIGAKERVLFKSALKEKVVARIDTGARTSSVHCIKYWFDRKEDRKALNFILINDKATPIRTFDFKKKSVKSSNGEIDVRYSVMLEVKMGEETFISEFTLAVRDKMRYHVLLGRNTLTGRFIVDVSKRFCLKKVITTKES